MLVVIRFVEGIGKLGKNFFAIHNLTNFAFSYCLFFLYGFMLGALVFASIFVGSIEIMPFMAILTLENSLLNIINC